MVLKFQQSEGPRLATKVMSRIRWKGGARAAMASRRDSSVRKQRYCPKLLESWC